MTQENQDAIQPDQEDFQPPQDAEITGEPQPEEAPMEACTEGDEVREHTDDEAVGEPEAESAQEEAEDELEDDGPPPENLKAAIEALLFAAGEPLKTRRIADAIGGVGTKTVREALNELKQDYDEQGRGFALEEIAGGFQLLSRIEFAENISKLCRARDDSRFSQASLETLAIIAYKQPIGRADIESIRGVQAGPLLRALLDRRLIKIVGRQDVPGRPFLYGTTRQFLERMGLKGLSDLPKAEDIKHETKE